MYWEIKPNLGSGGSVNPSLGSVEKQAAKSSENLQYLA